MTITPENITWTDLDLMRRMRDEKAYSEIREVMGYEGTDAEVLKKLIMFIHEEARGY